MAPQLFTAIPANLAFGVQYRFQSYLPTTRARPGEMPGGEPEK
jgi:hypothetical protein